MRDYDSLNEYDALPAHKRPGYAERMYEAADMRRKAKKEDEVTELINQQENTHESI